MIMMPYGWTLDIAAAHRPGRLLAPGCSRAEDRLMGHHQDMQRRQVWPGRYRVTARSGLGPARNLSVVTWLGPEKAIAMAARAGGRGFGTSDGIDDVAVDGLGLAGGDRRGVVVILADLHDRHGILRADIAGRPATSACTASKPIARLLTWNLIRLATPLGSTR